MKIRLHPLTRGLMALIALALGAVFVVPLWQIQLEAPQYPEGLGMNIWINRLSGDLSTINGLNHYIGMMEIHPESFAELKFMPVIVGFFMAFGLLIAIVNRRALLTAWFGLLALSGLAGIWDFWRWTYDYGHKLNPYAAIKVPGMSYQPPVFGSKTLLNFKAHSYPDLGGWLLIGIGFLVFALLAWEWLRKHPEAPQNKGQNKGFKKLTTHLGMAFILAPFLALSTTACSPKPEPIVFTEDNCHFCKMTVMDPKYGAELVTDKGKIYKYDSVECLARHLNKEADLTGKAHSLWVIDADQPGTLIPAQAAFYLYSLKLPSPMGAFLTPVKARSGAEALMKIYPGKILSWEEILAQIKATPTHSRAQDHPEMVSDLEKAQTQAQTQAQTKETAVVGHEKH
jgi:copper chaperone NosL